MSLLDSINPVKGIVAYALGACLAASLAYNVVQAFDITKLGRDIADLKTQIAATDADAARRDRENGEQVRTLEHRLADANDQREKTNAANKKLSDERTALLRQRTRAAGGPGLRDPYAEACPNSGATAAPAAAADSGAGDAAPAGRLLSEFFERDLVELTYRAEAVSIAYSACRAYAVDLLQKLQPPGETHADANAPPDPD